LGFDWVMEAKRSIKVLAHQYTISVIEPTGMEKLLFAIFLLSLVVLMEGCISGPNLLIPQEKPEREMFTPTPNATLRAISIMLTETRAAPTITLTPAVTPTQSPTPTATIPPPGSSTRPIGIGDRASFNGAALTVLSSKTLDTVKKVKAESGYTFQDLEVVIENTSNFDIDYTPLYFRLQGLTGPAYQPSQNSVWPALQSGTLRPGEWVRGHITFSLPLDKNPQFLTFSPQATPQQQAPIWIDLNLPMVQASLPETNPVQKVELPSGLGYRIEKEGIALTVGNVKAGQQIEQTKAGTGNILVVLDVTIENNGRTKTPYNPEYFTVEDANGYEYPAFIIPSETLLPAGSLGQGQKVNGHVVFEVPNTTKKLIVKYQPQVVIDIYPEIRIQISINA
jgi:hypothetical protein